MTSAIEWFQELGEISRKGGIILMPPYLFQKLTGDKKISGETYVLMGRCHIYPFKTLEDDVCICEWEDAPSTPIKITEDVARSLYESSLEAEITWSVPGYRDVKLTEPQKRVLGYLVNESWPEDMTPRQSAGADRTMAALERKGILITTEMEGEEYWSVTVMGMQVWHHLQSQNEPDPVWLPGDVLVALSDFEINGSHIPRGATGLVVRDHPSIANPELKVFVCFLKMDDARVRMAGNIPPWFSGDELSEYRGNFKVHRSMQLEPVVGYVEMTAH